MGSEPFHTFQVNVEVPVQLSTCAMVFFVSVGYTVELQCFWTCIVSISHFMLMEAGFLSPSTKATCIRDTIFICAETIQHTQQTHSANNIPPAHDNAVDICNVHANTTTGVKKQQRNKMQMSTY